MIKNIDDSFKSFFFNVMPKEFYVEIENMDSTQILPKKEHIFRVFEMPLKEIKVVILGQDPYIRKNQAIGYAFAVSEDTPKPPSLRIIEKEIGNPIDRTMKNLVSQGVFLLNTALTVEIGNSGSHIEFWKTFTNSIIRFISQNNNDIIWLLWGKHAQNYVDHINSGNILVAPHPAAEVYKKDAGFIGCNHFSMVNSLLKSKNKKIINWL